MTKADRTRRLSTLNDDDSVLGTSIEVVRDARERAPADFLVAIAVVLLAIAAVLLIGGAIIGGWVQDLCFNLGSEALGAWLTVVLIDGLWKRQETGASARLREIEVQLAARRDTADSLDVTERQEWRAFVADYRDLTDRRTLLDRIRSARGYGRRAHELELRAEAMLRVGHDRPQALGSNPSIE
jgi:hypothetical protein